MTKMEKLLKVTLKTVMCFNTKALHILFRCGLILRKTDTDFILLSCGHNELFFSGITQPVKVFNEHLNIKNCL